MPNRASPKPDHAGIIVRGGGPAAFARKIERDPNTVKAWKRLHSIPAEHWAGIANAGLATLEELALAAAARPRKVTTPDARASA